MGRPRARPWAGSPHHTGILRPMRERAGTAPDGVRAVHRRCRPWGHQQHMGVPFQHRLRPTLLDHFAATIPPCIYPASALHPDKPLTSFCPALRPESGIPLVYSWSTRRTPQRGLYGRLVGLSDGDLPVTFR